MNSTDLTEPVSAPDPEQLPLGMFEGVPLVPVETIGPDDEIVIIPVREPPVCGEWSYDDSELEEPRFVASRIDGVDAPTSKATPIHPIRAIAAPRGAAQPAALRAAELAVARAAAHTVSHESAAVGAPRARKDPEAPTPSRALRPTIAALRLAFEQGPGDTARALAYIAALEKKGDNDLALAAIETAQAAGADAFQLLCAKASALGAKLRYSDAEKALKQAAKMKSDSPDVLLQQGILACRRGRWREAVEPLKKSVALAPENAMAHYFYGEVLNQTDNLAGALAAYERAAELEADHWRALKGVGVMLDRLGRSDEAAAFYRRSREAQRA
ncbi:MAG TPA: tetratricopeptide repeat protein [Gemmatimonadaceae bacterium]|nr:tetratricopeptide repeat protein [Gemmatimonadaceae bacterium]